jgi:hypothetical protein
MVECDTCKTWFHGECVGIPQAVQNIASFKYTCVGCFKKFRQNDGFDEREAEGKLYNLLAKKRVPVE